MTFAVSLPWWGYALAVTGAVAAARAGYAGAHGVLTRPRRLALTALRAATLLLVAACLLRPVRVLPAAAAGEVVVPVLVDASRSMALTDAGTHSRFDAARAIVERRIAPGLAGRFTMAAWTFGDRLEPLTPDAVSDHRRTDLSAALRELRERYRGHDLPGVIVISDGGDTGARDAAAALDEFAVPIHTIGVGLPTGQSDVEVLDLTAGESRLAGSSIDLAVTLVGRGETAPLDVRVLENGRPIETRQVIPQAAGSPVREVFTVSPPRETATVYTIDVAPLPGEAVDENNRRSIVVEPPGRLRRILVVEGAPGFEHAFLKRALAADPGMEVDSVVRKGTDAAGNPTYLVHAPADRASALEAGFPGDREALYRYDALIVANVEPHTLPRAALDLAADFVANRGGGLLVLGGRSLATRGFAGTPIEEVLPVGLARGDLLTGAAPGTASLTAQGRAHPVTRIAAGGEESSDRWAAFPPLPAVAAVGDPRPGAQVLVVTGSGGAAQPLVAVQRYGHGRSMVFAGEGAWQWRMALPSSDTSYESFWRQAVRWLAAGAPDPVEIVAPDGLLPGDSGRVAVDVRDAAFSPVADAEVSVQVAPPGGGNAEVIAALDDPATGRYVAELTFERPGLYKISARVHGSPGDAAPRWVLVGGVARELADPRLNEDVLRRLSRASGGSYLPLDDLPTLPSLLAAGRGAEGAPEVRELWHTGWTFLAIVLALAAEWGFRRRWGLF